MITNRDLYQHSDGLNVKNINNNLRFAAKGNTVTQ